MVLPVIWVEPAAGRRRALPHSGPAQGTNHQAHEQQHESSHADERTLSHVRKNEFVAVCALTFAHVAKEKCGLKG